LLLLLNMKTRLTFIIAGLVLAVTLVMLAYGTPQTDRVNIRYVTPKDAAHQPIYLDIQRRGTLEKLKIILSPLLLPRPLRPGFRVLAIRIRFPLFVSVQGP
jgi:hypothetical protein